MICENGRAPFLAALRRMPSPLLVAQLGAVAVGLLGVAHGLVASLDGDADRSDSTYVTLLAGSSLAISVLTVVGLAWLRSRLSGVARLGVQIALVAAVLRLASHLAWQVVVVYQVVTQADSSLTSWNVHSIAGSAIAIVFAVGLGIAARRWYWIVVGTVVALVTSPPWFVAEPMFAWVAGNLRGTILLMNGLALAAAVTTFVVSAHACRDAGPSAEPPRLSSGLGRITHALRGLVIATVLLVGFTLLVDSSDATDGLLAAYRFMIVLATAFQLSCLIGLSLGALDTIRGRSEMPGWLLVASATAVLCVAGRTLFRAIDLIQRYFTHYFDHTRGLGSRIVAFFGPEEPSLISAISTQLLTACAIGAVLVAVAIAARRRGLEALRARTMVTCCVFVGLALGAITAQQWIAGVRELTPLGVVVMVAANTALAASWLVAAGIAHRGATTLGDGPSLPSAKVVRG